MPDIAMCSNDECRNRKRCYRFMAEPSAIQSYSDFAPAPGDGQCEDFWSIKRAPTKLRDEATK